MDFLIPLDLKPHSQQSVDLARRLFNLQGKTVTLLHVFEEPGPGELLADAGGNLLERYLDATVDPAKELLSRVGTVLREAGADVEVVVRDGRPAFAIREMIESQQPKVVITVPGKHSPKELMLHGSISATLLRTSFAGTLILARPNRESGKSCALFLLDGTPESMRALEEIAPILEEHLQIMLVASRLGYASSSGAAQLFLPGAMAEMSWEDRERATCEDAIARGVRMAERLGRVVTSELVDTAFETWLKSQEDSQPASLLVMSRTRHDVLHRPLTGAPSEHLFMEAKSSTALYCADGLEAAG